MNYVNLIGKMTSLPVLRELENGRKVAQFTLSTKETYIDADGNAKKKSHWHRLSAWGNWVNLIQELGKPGLNVAIEGKLVTRFYNDMQGKKQIVSEVEVNDLIVL